MRITILVFFLFIALALSGSVNNAKAQASCQSAHCQYLPLMHNPAPVHITIAQAGSIRYVSMPIRVVGEVEATGGIPAYGVVIEASAYNIINPSLISTTLGTTLFTATLPGQINPFDFSMIGVTADEYIFKEARIITWTLESELSYVALTTVLTVTQIDFGHGTYVDVQVRNDSGLPVENVQAVVWALGEGYSNYLRPVAPALAPGESAYFSDYVDHIYYKPEEYIQALAQGVVATP